MSYCWSPFVRKQGLAGRSAATYSRAVRFEKDLRVRFAHVDGAGITFYPRFFEWFHDAFEDFFEAVFGVPYAEILRVQQIGFPAVQVATEFKSPARFGELVKIEVFISRLTARSATFEYRVWREGTQLAAASIKVVGMSMDTHKPMPFPDNIHEGLSAYVDEDDEGPQTERLRA